MKKRILSLVVAMTMLLSFIPVIAHAATSGTCGDNLTWTLDDEGTLTISGTGDMTNWSSSSSVPWYSSRSGIKNVIIGNGVTSIGGWAFDGYSGLTSVTIPDSVTSIGYHAFQSCSGLTSITIPDSVTSIGDKAFISCGSLEDVTIPDSVTSIGEYTFAYCSSLTSVTIGNSVTSIGKDAFLGCSSLTSIEIPGSVTSIGRRAFYECSGLTSVTIPDTLTSIGEEAFYQCISLESVTIPDSVTSIGYSAFQGCSGLTSITIPDSVINIGVRSFEYCSNLISINVNSANKNYYSVDGILFDKNKTMLIQYPMGKKNTEYVIPNSVTSIGEYAFRYCRSLESVTIPDSVTSIGSYAFSACSSLTSIEIPGSVTSIGFEAFECCSSLTSVTIPESVTSIGKKAFYECKSLTSATIPESVTSIGEYTFAYCRRLTSVTFSNSITSIDKAAFLYCSLTDVYYGGSEEQWNNISIGSSNTDLTNARIHFNSHGIPSGTQGNTNSTSNGAPIITSAKLTHSGNTYDIFNQAVTIENDSDITALIEATVDANGNNNVKVYITQGIGKEIEIGETGVSLTPGKDFSPGKTIYIMAVDEVTGKSTSKATKLKIASLASGELGGQSGVEGLNFKLGQDTGFTIPDSVPVFGGTDIQWSFDFIPISVEYDKEDNNKINVVFGTNITKKKGDDDREYFSDFNFEEYKKGVKKAASKQNRTLKQLRNDFKMTNDVKMNMFGGNLLGGGSGKGGSSVDVAGYAEMHVTENGLQFAEGQLCLNVEFTYNYQGQIFIWVVPLYYEFGGGAGVGFEGNMINVNPISFSPEFEAYITGKVKGSIGGGVGIAKVATAGAAGEAALNLKKSLKSSYFKADVDGSANFNVKVFGKTVAEKEFARGNFLIYETGNSKGLINGGGISLSSVEDEGTGYFGFEVDIDSVYPNESRTYAENTTEWLGDKPQINLMSVDYTNKNLSKLADNIYTECAPQICEIDGKKIMVMQWDNSDRADADRTMLVYSVYDDESGTWSAPVAVDDDGTADFYPYFQNGYLVWQNEKSTLTDDMTLKEIAELGEIYISKWNGSGFDAPVAVTDNNSLDTQPSVTTDGDTVHIVWTTNSEDDIMGQSGTNSIMQSDYDGTTLTAPTAVKSGLNAITNISTGIADSTFCIAYVTDDDNDFDTIEDRDIRIIADGGETQLTDNDVLDSNPVFANNMIYYYSGGNIAYSDLYGTDVKTVFDGPKAGLTDSFVVDGNYKGDTAVWWTKTLDGCTEVYSSLYKDGEWSDEIQVTSVGNIAKYPSGILNNNGTMLVAFNNGIAEDNEIVKTDLYTISVTPSYDIELSDAYFDEDTMTAYAKVTNKGELAIEAYKAVINDNNEKIISEPLKAGESAEIEIEYQKPDDFSKRDIELSVSLGSVEEYDLTNNSATLSIGNADIAVENVAVDEAETTVSADVSNVGYDDASDVKVQLREGSVTGVVIDEKALNLAVGDKQSIAFDIDKSDMSFFDATKQLYVTASGDFEEVSLGNNDGYVYITSPSGSPDYQTEILNYSEIDGKYMINSIARNNTDTAISCVMYSVVYSSDGTLKACGTVKADIDADNDTGVDITVPCIIETGDTIKTFMWADNMTPLAKAGELVIQ